MGREEQEGQEGGGRHGVRGGRERKEGREGGSKGARAGEGGRAEQGAGGREREASRETGHGMKVEEVMSCTAHSEYCVGGRDEGRGLESCV